MYLTWFSDNLLTNKCLKCCAISLLFPLFKSVYECEIKDCETGRNWNNKGEETESSALRMNTHRWQCANPPDAVNFGLKYYNNCTHANICQCGQCFFINDTCICLFNSVSYFLYLSNYHTSRSAVLVNFNILIFNTTAGLCITKSII